MKVSVIIPSYRVRQTVLGIIGAIGDEVSAIFVVDDCCPENSGKFVEQNCSDRRVKVLYHQENKGVGGATITGYKAALQEDSEIIVKLDGDGQMDPKLIKKLIRPIEQGLADYSKGNRFFNLESLKIMPPLRLFGNSILSFVNKAVSGYWNLMDPTNGFTAIHANVLKMLPLDKLDQSYFFESDMLFRLNTVRAVIKEMPMKAVYEGEKSNVKIGKICFAFPGKYLERFFKRIFYNYFLRDFNSCSIELVLGLLLVVWGGVYGLIKWHAGVATNSPTPLGSIMLAALPIIIGCELLLAALNFDVMNNPKEPIHLHF